MKAFILIISLAFIIACNNNNGGINNMADSLGNRVTDSARGDTAYYERLHQKTSPSDTTSATANPSKDTAYYERLPNKINPPDSSR
jgi:hypothetical protein